VNGDTSRDLAQKPFLDICHRSRITTHITPSCNIPCQRQTETPKTETMQLARATTVTRATAPFKRVAGVPSLSRPASLRQGSSRVSEWSYSRGGV